MPRGTTLRNVRVADPLWSAARAVAEKRGESLSEVLRAALAEYVERYESLEDACKRIDTE